MSWAQPRTVAMSLPLPAPDSLRLLVCGDRNWGNYTRMYGLLDELRLHLGIECIIEGEARGADRMAKSWAQREGIPWQAYPALWDKYHKGAGPIRNQQMLDEGKPDAVLAFHDNFECSRGTHDMVYRALYARLPTFLVTSYTCELVRAQV